MLYNCLKFKSIKVSLRFKLVVCKLACQRSYTVNLVSCASYLQDIWPTTNNSYELQWGVWELFLIHYLSNVTTKIDSWNLVTQKSSVIQKKQLRKSAIYFLLRNIWHWNAPNSICTLFIYNLCISKKLLIQYQ